MASPSTYFAVILGAARGRIARSSSDQRRHFNCTENNRSGQSPITYFSKALKQSFVQALRRLRLTISVATIFPLNR
jgi:hypothetical protein